MSAIRFNMDSRFVLIAVMLVFHVTTSSDVKEIIMCETESTEAESEGVILNPLENSRYLTCSVTLNGIAPHSTVEITVNSLNIPENCAWTGPDDEPTSYFSVDAADVKLTSDYDQSVANGSINVGTANTTSFSFSACDYDVAIHYFNISYKVIQANSTVNTTTSASEATTTSSLPEEEEEDQTTKHETTTGWTTTDQTTTEALPEEEKEDQTTTKEPKTTTASEEDSEKDDEDKTTKAKTTTKKSKTTTKAPKTEDNDKNKESGNPEEQKSSELLSELDLNSILTIATSAFTVGSVALTGCCVMCQVKKASQSTGVSTVSDGKLFGSKKKSYKLRASRRDTAYRNDVEQQKNQNVEELGKISEGFSGLASQMADRLPDLKNHTFNLSTVPMIPLLTPSSRSSSSSTIKDEELYVVAFTPDHEIEHVMSHKRWLRAKSKGPDQDLQPNESLEFGRNVKKI